jgi:multidrug efflux pump subunit AcrA (membrane-fusion protein)
LQTSLAAQQSVSAAQRSLDAAVQRLTTLLDAEASSTASNTNGTGNGTGLSTGTGTQTGAQTGASTGAQSNGGSSTAKTASAADLEADQTRVDAASAKLAVAVEALSQARVTTPIAGTVIAVNIPAGDAVSANSSTATIVVAGAKGYEVTTSVPVTQIARVTVGQQASVLPDGAASTINGRVSEISALPATSTTGTIGYTVVISLDHAPSTLADGTTGSVSITTDAAKAALVVPSSAVHTSGKRHTVTVALASSRTKTVTVTLGVQGAITTQIRQGVAAGQQVVIADLHKALPSSATSTQSSSRTNRNAPSDLGGGVTGGPPGGFTPPSR